MKADIDRTDIRSVLVAVITYKRPSSLRALLDSVFASRSAPQFRVAVVDNDAAGSASWVASLYGDGVLYVIEPEPGIAAARNRCLDLVSEDDDAIVFVDDDETVASNWLANLVRCANVYKADMVGGNVLSVLPSDTPDWIRRGQFHQRRMRETGDRTGLPGTGNVLVRTAIMSARPDIRFDGAFSATGGSDTDFLQRLSDAGANFVWCGDAVVSEHVQPERVRLGWLVRRYTRGGEGYARLQLRQHSRLRIAAEGLAYCVAAVLAAPFTLIVFPRERRRNFILFFRGRGMLRALRGKYHEEYARPSSVA